MNAHLSNNPVEAVAAKRTATLFEPARVGVLPLKNRVFMSTMTRPMALAGVPGDANTEYYRTRAAGDAGLIITEGTWVPHDAAANEVDVPRMYGVEARGGCEKVVDAGLCHAPRSNCMPPTLVARAPFNRL
ncbi:oxidoreductase [Paraburkholderia dipogonis]|uniref:oxidoreductase n=1 Tax=Paraburkholderia dipogonis TaxID=1211383 RepID=UPI0038B960B3